MHLPSFEAFDSDLLRLMTTALDAAIDRYAGPNIDDVERACMGRRVIFAAGHGDRDLDLLARAALDPAAAFARLQLPAAHRSSA